MITLQQLAEAVNARQILSDSAFSGDTPITDMVCRTHEGRADAVYAVIDEFLDYSIWRVGRELFEEKRPAAQMLIVKEPIEGFSGPQIIVEDPRKAAGLGAAAIHGNPAHQLKVVGITGTNGKTTTSHMTAQLLTRLGIPTASMGTVGLKLPSGEVRKVGYTTPLATDLHRALRGVVEERCEGISMEISSHAIALERNYRLPLDVAVLTNVTRDHLEFHATLEEYQSVKKQLFNEDAKAAVINAADRIGQEIIAEFPRQALRYSSNDAISADLVASAIQFGEGRTRFTARYLGDFVEIDSPFFGMFNVENLLAAMGSCLVLGHSFADVVQGVAELQAVDGRMQRVEIGRGVTALVDFAHTADSLEKVLRSLRPGVKGRLIVVFGCGGDRDKGKRPEMARLAEELADVVVVTSDNPRSEDPDAIIDEVMLGFKNPSVVYRFADRKDAVLHAVDLTQPGDVLLVAGKGHEQGQIFADRVEPYSDVAVLEAIAE